MKTIIIFLFFIILFASSCLSDRNSSSYSEDKNKIQIKKMTKEEKAFNSFKFFWNSDMLKFHINIGINNPIEYHFHDNNINFNEKIYLLDFALFIKNKDLIEKLLTHGAKRSCEILKTKCEPLSPEIEKILNGDK